MRAPETEARKKEKSTVKPLAKVNPYMAATALTAAPKASLTQLLHMPRLSALLLPSSRGGSGKFMPSTCSEDYLCEFLVGQPMWVGVYAHVYLGLSVPHRKELQSRTWRRQGAHQKLMK